VPLAPKVFDILLVLLQNHDRLIDKSELMTAVWPDTSVEEENLTQGIYVLRRVLNECPNEHRYIVTIPGRGYRFVAPVRKVDRVEPDSELLASGGPSEAQTAATRSIAVLPFRLLTGESRSEYLGLGMADALINRLSKIKKVAVRSATSVLRYGNTAQDPLAAGREQGVDFVITGAIQTSGHRIRATVQLLRISDGVTIWADKFDEKFSDIFNLEDCICGQVVKALKLTLTRQENRQVGNIYTANGEAYQACLKGRYFWSRRTFEGLNKAVVCFEKAILKDSGYAAAYAGLADCYNMLALYGLMPPQEGWLRAKAAASRALSVDNELVEARACLAVTKMGYEWDWEGAERECQLALSHNPGYAMAHDYYAEYLIAMGALEQAMAEVMGALELEPLNLVVNRDLGCVFYFMHRYEEAIKQLRSTVEMDPNFAVGRWSLAWAYEQNGMYKEALAELREAIRLSGGSVRMIAEMGYAYAAAGNGGEAEKVLQKLSVLSDRSYVSPYEIAIIYLALGNEDQAFRWLENAFEHRPWALVYLKVEPKWDPLRSDLRFQKLLRRAGLHR
jgi:TolB-like protein/Tfp pilus assembly protein PilF